MSQTQTEAKGNISKEKEVIRGKENTSITQCPTPPAGKFEMPEQVKDDYYKKINLSNKKINEIEDKKEGLLATAQLKMKDTNRDSELIKQKSLSDFEDARKDFEINEEKLNDKTENNKSQHFRDYNQELRDAEPNSNTPTPDDKKAILIAKLKKNLALEDLEYQKKYKELRTTLAEAENKKKLAIEIYEADLCIAKSQEIFDACEIELTWRTEISTALADINK